MQCFSPALDPKSAPFVQAFLPPQTRQRAAHSVFPMRALYLNSPLTPRSGLRYAMSNSWARGCFSVHLPALASFTIQVFMQAHNATHSSGVDCSAEFFSPPSFVVCDSGRVTALAVWSQVPSTSMRRGWASARVPCYSTSQHPCGEVKLASTACHIK